ncbi:LPIN3 phosphatase, partial [Thinocorus orbignyianus]|nr:LPIN3 phosphatase [Thinocorus orbignyianus]
MNYVGQLAETVFVTVKELYQGLNPATLTGCIDVVVVRQPDNSFQCSPFHVCFGKLEVLHSKEKVVDIEINGEPVDLHMKLGDNGEAFFVQESEENEGSIPSRLCTSPIPREESPEDATLASHGQEASGAEATLCKRRWHRRKPKHKELLDSGLEGCKETKREISMEEPCKLSDPREAKLPSFFFCSDSLCFSSADLPEEETKSLKSPEVHPYSDGELASMESPTLSQPSSPKSDSELEIKPQESLTLGAESHVQWTWGRLPRTFATAATTVSVTPVPVGEATPLVATCEGLGGGPSTLGHQREPGSSAVSVVEPTPAACGGNSLPGLKDVSGALGAESLLEASSALQKKQEEGGSVVPEAQPDVEPFEGADAPKQVASEDPNPQLGNQRRQGSIKRSPHLGPSDVYLEDLSSLDKKQVAVYFSRSDTEQSSDPVADPSNPLCVQLTSDLPTDSPMDPDPDFSTIALSLCGGLGDSRQISHEEFMEHMVSYQQFAENPGLIDDPNLVILINKKYYNWAVAAPMVLSLQAFQRNIPESTIDRLVKEKMPKKGSRWWFSWRRREFPAEEVFAVVAVTVGCPGHRGHSGGWQVWGDDEPLHPREILAVGVPVQKSQPTYKKSLRLSSEQIGRLKLQDGPNEVAFSVMTQYQGTCRCEATIYLWNWDDKVVISDIDGTITKSDALGRILPHLGKDWTHRGIAKLFHKIHLNGYKFLYCSARAIGMAHITKGYFKWVNEQGCALPKGPILLAPSSLFSAFHREVIEKKPEVFKIACLMDIQNLFATKLPFHAAFGNRTSDVYAYKRVGLPESRIFTVNPKGELIQELTKNHKSTYERLSELVELIFPPL